MVHDLKLVESTDAELTDYRGPTVCINCSGFLRVKVNPKNNVISPNMVTLFELKKVNF